jgi:acetyl esterase
MPLRVRRFRVYYGIFLVSVGGIFGGGREALAQGISNLPDPTYAAVAYGSHPQQVLDFWSAGAAEARPLVLYFHGGGFTSGSRHRVGAGRIARLRSAGIHVAAVGYRLAPDSPLPAAHDDAIRAVQFLRSKAVEWSIDPERVGGTGGSAGAQLVAFLAWHDDFADPDSPDPVARESSRLTCVAPLHAQSTMDLQWWIEHIPGYDRPHRRADELTSLTGVALHAVQRELSIINHISPDDPPTFLTYAMAPDDPLPEKNPRGWIIHHVNFGLALEGALRAAGVEAYLQYPGAPTPYADEVAFLAAFLKE